MVYGHSTDYYDGKDSVELYSYAEFNGFDNDDKYRLMDISARGSNRDGAALRYVAEALSVIIQVVSFRLTGKRVFRMSPLHHHFELCGMQEKAVVGMFWGAACCFCVIALAAL